MQAGFLKLYCLRVACVELGSLWNWNTKERFYFLSQSPGISWSSFSFFFFSLSITQNLTQVDMGWSPWFASYRMALLGSWHHRRMSPPLLAAPPVTFKQGQADSIMNHPFWNKTWYLRHILLTVWFCPLEILFWKTRCRNIWNSQTRITYTCTCYKIVYPEDTTYVFVDWLNNPQVHQGPAFFSSVTRNTWRNYCIWAVSPREFLSQTFILCNRNSIRLN